MTQIETRLDICLRKWRLSELDSIIDDVRQLRGSATDINFAIEELEMRVSTLRKLAFDVRMLSLNKKGQLSLTNPRDACEKFARFM